MQLALGIGLIVFFALMVGISLLVSKRIHTGEDYVVGRLLSDDPGGDVLSPGFPAILFVLCIVVYASTDRIVRLVERGN